MKSPRLTAMTACVLAALVTVAPTAGADEPTKATQPTAASSSEPRRVLPLLQDKIPEAYRAHVPLPFGVSFNYFRMSERLALSDAALVFNGQPVPSQLIQTDSPRRSPIRTRLGSTCGSCRS